jgi:hypothetical protein
MNWNTGDVREGSLANIRDLKAKAWKRLKNARAQLKDEPMGGRRHELRVAILRIESEHSDLCAKERGILAAIARNAGANR